MALTDKKRRFALEYLIDLNATAAAVRAGYSKRSAHNHGHRLIKDDEVAALIRTAIEARRSRVEVTVDRVVEELASIAFLDPRDLFGTAGELLPITEIPECARRALASFEFGSTDGEARVTVSKVRFWDKLSALSMLARHLGMFAEADASIDGQRLIDAINAGRARVAAMTPPRTVLGNREHQLQSSLPAPNGDT